MNHDYIAIVGAMQSEVELLNSKLSDTRIQEYCGSQFLIGKMFSCDVVIVKSGIGKVNAARATQMLVDIYKPKLIINTGIAGGTDPKIKISDCVVATSFVQHDFDVTAFGYAKGYMCTGVNMDKPTIYQVDEGVKELLIQTAKEKLKNSKVYSGIIASGDIFLQNEAFKAKIFSKFNALCAEMEGAAIAQVASFAKVPFAALRIISDTAKGDAASDFDEFEKKQLIFQE